MHPDLLLLIGISFSLGFTPGPNNVVASFSGFNFGIKKTLPLETFVSNDAQFEFHTYIVVVQSEFIPVLNSEHNGYAWCSFGKWPKPLHLGLRNTLQNKVNLLKLETVFKTISLLDEK